MKKVIGFALIFCLWNCQSETNDTSTHSTVIQVDSSQKDSISITTVDDTWHTYFQEVMQKSNAMKIEKDSAFFNLVFDLHSWGDAGARDCYQSIVSFAIPYQTKLSFPQQINLGFEEIGACIPEEAKRPKSFADFILKEEGADCLIYTAKENGNVMVLFKNTKKSGTYAYYFGEENAKNIITKDNIHSLVEQYNDEDETAIYPYKSSYLNI